jgi:uncharacterized protein YndB with AHSA1/START domain
MTNFGTLKITTPSDREIAMTRVFDAPRSMVFDAFTKPELIKRWLGVRAGWTMPVCEVDLKVGGKYRYVWRGPSGNEMGMGGVFREIKRPERVVATEKFDESWYAGEAVDTTVFVEKGGKTTVTLAVLYASKEARDGVLKSPMASGVEESYQALDALLASTAAKAGK